MHLRRHRFDVAGVGVALALRAPADVRLPQCYEHYTAQAGEPALRLEVTVDEAFSGTPGTGEYPGFDSTATPEGLRLWRVDAEGTLSLQANQVCGQFRCCGQGGMEAAIRVGLSVTLPRHDGLILHSSAVAFNHHRAVAFMGRSGAGKSTISELLTAGEPDRLKLSDELFVVRKIDGQWLAHVAPFHGSQPLPHGEYRPLGAIYFIRHAEQHCCTPAPSPRSLPSLLQNVLVYATAPQTAAEVLAVGADLAYKVPSFDLAFAPTKDVEGVLPVT